MSEGYGFPQFGGAAEMRSLILHSAAGEGLRTDYPNQRDYEHIMNILVEWFSAAKWSIPEDFLEFSHYLRVLMQLDWTSSPGHPYCRNAPTNGILFKVKEGRPDTERIMHYWELVRFKISEKIPDKIRIFIKGEPLVAKKVLNKQYRLISSVSVIDQIVDHMLFGVMNQNIIDNYPELPTRIGWSPYNGGYRMLPKSKWLAIDKSKWDWTVKPWMLEMELELRMRLCSNMTEKWRELACERYKSLFDNPEFICSNGITFRQKQPGIMKSGCVNTISTNSIIQVLLHTRVCIELGQDIYPIFVMGDDTLQHPVANTKEYVDKLSEYCIVKHHKNANEFAGVEFKEDGTVEPLYKGKHAYTLLHMNPEYLQEIAASYTLLYHRSSDRKFFRGLFEDMGVSIPTESRQDEIWESEE